MHNFVATLHRSIGSDLPEIGALLLAFDFLLFILLAIFWKQVGPSPRKPGRRG